MLVFLYEHLLPPDKELLKNSARATVEARQDGWDFGHALLSRYSSWPWLLGNDVWHAWAGVWQWLYLTDVLDMFLDVLVSYCALGRLASPNPSP